jgi:membrane protein insertase Oxa1/YidC/SpoIIIJ
MVGVSTYVQTRLFQTPATTPQQQQQQQMMTWMMPLVLVWITLALPSGVGVYWVVSNIFSVFASYIVYGRSMTWRNLLPIASATPNKTPRPKVQPDVQEEAETDPSPNPQEARSAHGKRRGKRKKRR